MPPTIGAAMRRITSLPVPSIHMIGTRAAIVVTTVITFGRTRSTGAGHDGIAELGERRTAPCGAAALLRLLPGVVQVDDHHNTGFGGHAGQRNEADCTATLML